MDQVGFLNLEYLFYHIYRIFSDADISELSARFGDFISTLEIIGLAISFVGLVALIYARMRASQVLHHLHETREEAMAHVQGQEKVKSERWQHVMTLINSANSSDWRQAIIEADIILGLLLNDLQVPGDSIGEKLKAVDKTRFVSLDLAWEAHKIRNDVAHAGSTFELSQRDAKSAVDLYRRVLEEFDFI